MKETSTFHKNLKTEHTILFRYYIKTIKEKDYCTRDIILEYILNNKMAAKTSPAIPATTTTGCSKEFTITFRSKLTSSKITIMLQHQNIFYHFFSFIFALNEKIPSHTSMLRLYDGLLRRLCIHA